MEYRGLTLDRFQEEAIAHLKADRSVLVAAPTGTGKTVVADWIVDDALARGQRVIYTAPIKALSNQKFRDYGRLHGEDNVGLVTGDLVIRRDAPCVVMTTEILRNMLLGGDDLTDLRAVVVDEVHFLDDRERGTVWEEVLIYLPQHVLVVALSATVPNLGPFSQWLSHVREREVAVVVETKRAVPLDFWFCTQGHGLLTPAEFAQKAKTHGGGHTPALGGHRGRGGDKKKGGRGRFRDNRTSPFEVIATIAEAEGLPMLYFVFSRHDAERFAKSLAFRFRADYLDPEEKALVAEAVRAAELGPALEEEVRDLYLRGIASHHAGLHVHLKVLVEKLYEAKLIKVLFCTSTFALGINMPARSVAFHGIEKYDGEEVRPLPTRGFMQKAGRAGRRGLDELGHVVVRMDFDELEEFRPVLQRYFEQVYEPVRSSFSLSWNSVVLLLNRHDLEGVRRIVDKSFLSWSLTQQAREQLARADQLEASPNARPGERKEARRLRTRAETAGDKCWNEFLEKRTFLETAGYLRPDGTMSAGARVLQHLQIAEILMTELVLSGLLEDLDGPTTFALMCALTSDLPRNVQLLGRIDRRDRELAEKVKAVRMSPPVVGAERISKQAVTFCPELMPLGRAWADGKSLETVLSMISSPTDWSGTLITGFRRAKDLAGQLLDVYADVPDRRDALRSMIKGVSRDEVEVVD